MTQISKDKKFPLPEHVIPLALRGGLEDVILGKEMPQTPIIRLPSRPERRKPGDVTK